MTRDGVQWDLDLRDDAHRLMLLDLYERELRRRALGRLPVGGIFVDVGANVGFWSVPAARRSVLAAGSLRSSRIRGLCNGSGATSS